MSINTKVFASQRELFHFISEDRLHRSFVSGDMLPMDLQAWHFAHVLPKAENKYPKFKCYEKNIVLLTREEHTIWDTKRYAIDITKQSGWIKLFELEQELIEEYYR